MTQLGFVFALVLCSWYGMMATHEFGHVLGAVTSGGTVTQVVLHPLSISRTDVAPNPHRAVVVWLGPIVGCVLPFCLFVATGKRRVVLRNVAGFFAGFCLVANGAYIGVGAWDAVGDCREMLQTGTPLWVMVLFGGFAVACGLLVWHRLGSVRALFKDPSVVSGRLAVALWLTLVVYLVVAVTLFPRS